MPESTRLLNKQELGIVYYIEVQAAAACPALPQEILDLANETYVSSLLEVVWLNRSEVKWLSIPWRRKFYKCHNLTQTRHLSTHRRHFATHA
jgi:hypothetical protein